jgi:hypothetical protein
MMQEQVVARAKSGIAIQKLVPIGEYLDLSESGILESNPLRYQALACAALEIIRTFRTDATVREACHDSSALLELLENLDFDAGAGVLVDSRSVAQSYLDKPAA